MVADALASGVGGQAAADDQIPAVLHSLARLPSQYVHIAAADFGEELAPQLGVVGVAAAPDARHRPRVLLPDAAHLRAKVRGFQVHCDSVRLHQLCERVGDLLAQALLHGETAREQAHQTSQLRDPDDPLVRDVADVRETVERQRMMLAKRVEGDRPFDDLAGQAIGIAAALGRECRQQLGVAVVAGRRFVERR